MEFSDLWGAVHEDNFSSLFSFLWEETESAEICWDLCTWNGKGVLYYFSYFIWKTNTLPLILKSHYFGVKDEAESSTMKISYSIWFDFSALRINLGGLHYWWPFMMSDCWERTCPSRDKVVWFGSAHWNPIA